MMKKLVSMLVLATGCATTGSADVTHPLKAGSEDLLQAYVPFATPGLMPVIDSVAVTPTKLGSGTYTPLMGPPHLKEPARIVKAGPDMIWIDFLMFSIYRDQMDIERDYKVWLETSDGLKIEGRYEIVSGLRDHSWEVDRALMDYHRQMVRIHEAGAQTQTYWALSNEYDQLKAPLFSRNARVVFERKALLSLKTKSVTFVLKGEGRERRWKFKFHLPKTK